MDPWHAAPLTLLVLVVGIYCHRNWLTIFPEDPPGSGRRRHVAPMPMAGWLPALCVLVAFTIQQQSGLLVGAIAIATVTGYLDDSGKSKGHEMKWYTKGALLAIAASLGSLHLLAQHDLVPIDFALTLLWLFGVTNAVNFMDNTDGVASSLGGMGLLLASGLTGPMAWAGFAFLGFVPGNWPRPRAFLGDSGSLSLGMCLACASVDFSFQSTAAPVSWFAVLPLSMFALDFVQVITARLLIGVPPWVGDRRHLTHVAMNLGLPRVLVAPAFVVAGNVLFAWLR